jgi:hypothetical protein
MAYEAATWSQLAQYLIQRIFVSCKDRKFVKKKISTQKANIKFR